MKGFRDFEFDLPTALLDRLVQLFASMDAAPLRVDVVQGIPEQQGVYLLHHHGKPVYVGKTDGESGLRSRLTRHCKRILHRRELNPDDVTFKAIRIYVFTVVDLETQLIRKFNDAEWNNSGFGSNDPGRERDTTKLKEDGFDAQFPIDIDLPLSIDLPAHDVSASEALAALKLHLPYVLRIGRDAQLRSVRVTVPVEARTTRAILASIVGSLPAGWQVTALAGRVIMYHEHREYAAGTVVARS